MENVTNSLLGSMLIGPASRRAEQIPDWLAPTFPHGRATGESMPDWLFSAFERSQSWPSTATADPRHFAPGTVSKAMLPSNMTVPSRPSLSERLGGLAATAPAISRSVTDALAVPFVDAYDALTGRMTEQEQKDFLLQAAIDLFGAGGGTLPPRAGATAALRTMPARAHGSQGPAQRSVLNRRLFPEYAEKYPPIGPPVQKVDPKTGKKYWAKQLTPEAKEFARVRSLIVKDMEDNGFEPYFPPDQRFHVNPSNYPPNTNTLNIVPKRQATINKHMSTYGSAVARQGLRDAAKRGSEIPGASDWHALGQVEQKFIEVLGADAGRNAFRDFVTSLAVTSAGANPSTNLLMALYANYLRRHGRPYPEYAHEMPTPIGGPYAMSNIKKHQRIFDAGGWQAVGLNDPKGHDYGQSFFGNPKVSPIDRRLMSVLSPGQSAPARGTYGLAARVVHQEAARAGQLPHPYRDLVWAGSANNSRPARQSPSNASVGIGHNSGSAGGFPIGIGHNSGPAGQLPFHVPGGIGHNSHHRPMIAHINEAIERTHRLTGMPREEIFIRGFILGEIPIYGIGGLAVLPALQTQPDGPSSSRAAPPGSL